MSKQWGHGFFSGKHQATESLLKEMVPFAEDYMKAKREWTMEEINSRMVHSGRLMIGRCPFHEEITPSCSYDPATDKFHCFGCGKQGDGETLARAISNLDT